MYCNPLGWAELEAVSIPIIDPERGPTSSQATLRLFEENRDSIRITLYRDHHAWCPYCQKVWLWLEEKRIPYRISKVTMFCYGEKETWFQRLVPSGMLPALQLDDQIITESDRIIESLERAYNPLVYAMGDSRVLPLRHLERLLFRAWCNWLCRPSQNELQEVEACRHFSHYASAMAKALEAGPGPFMLGEFSTADLVFIPYLERMNASLAYYKGYLLRQRYPAIDRWFSALEQRSTYLGTQGDFHTHAHDLPPQMGGCFACDTPDQKALAKRIDSGPWPIMNSGSADPETSQPEPDESAAIALFRVLKHRRILATINPLANGDFDLALRCALTLMVSGRECVPPPGSALALRYLRDRISVPRDMPLHSARLLRRALEGTACLDPVHPGAQPDAVPIRNRRDQDPKPFKKT